MKYFCLVLILGFTINLCAQQNSEGEDLKYLEDQFYVGITYNLILNKPEGVTQSNFSYGLQGGIIKDIPLNIGRNVGIGIGLGEAYKSYYSNLFLHEPDRGFD